MDAFTAYLTIISSALLVYFAFVAWIKYKDSLEPNQHTSTHEESREKKPRLEPQKQKLTSKKSVTTPLLAEIDKLEQSILNEDNGAKRMEMLKRIKELKEQL